MLQLSQNIKKVAKESVDPNLGSLSISITHALTVNFGAIYSIAPKVSINVIEAIPNLYQQNFKMTI